MLWCVCNFCDYYCVVRDNIYMIIYVIECDCFVCVYKNLLLKLNIN